MRKRWVKWLGLVAVGLGVMLLLAGPMWHMAMRWWPAWMPEWSYTDLARVRRWPAFTQLYIMTVIRPAATLDYRNLPSWIEPASRYPRWYYHEGVEWDQVAVDGRVVSVSPGEYGSTDKVVIETDGGGQVEFIFDRDNSFLMEPGEFDSKTAGLCFERVFEVAALGDKVQPGDKMRVVYNRKNEARVITMLSNMELEGLR